MFNHFAAKILPSCSHFFFLYNFKHFSSLKTMVMKLVFFSPWVFVIIYEFKSVQRSSWWYNSIESLCESDGHFKFNSQACAGEFGNDFSFAVQIWHCHWAFPLNSSCCLKLSRWLNKTVTVKVNVGNHLSGMTRKNSAWWACLLRICSSQVILVA